MLRSLKLKIQGLLNAYRRRKGMSLPDRCAEVIMRTCSLQMEREETRELAPVKGATGPMLLSGGAITRVQYRVFDRNADAVDKSIQNEAWRAYAYVTMWLTLENDPQFEVRIEDTAVEPKDLHKAPGLDLITHLSTYFPLLPKPHQGPLIHPVGAA